MSKYKLYYFDTRGRGEIARLIFLVAGEPFEDIRYDKSQWATLRLETPLGFVPVLDYEGVKLPQSLAIGRFLAKQFNLAGRDNFEQAKVDAVVDTIVEGALKFIPARFETDEAKRKEMFNDYFTNVAPKLLKDLETLSKLYGNDGPYFVGNQLTWADLLVHDVFETLLGLNPNLLNDHPWLQANRALIDNHPRLIEHFKTRTKSPF
jgi:prostaglandin-H2 D-isomerase / glutathione transferase